MSTLLGHRVHSLRSARTLLLSDSMTGTLSCPGLVDMEHEHSAEAIKQRLARDQHTTTCAIGSTAASMAQSQPSQL